MDFRGLFLIGINLRAYDLFYEYMHTNCIVQGKSLRSRANFVLSDKI